MSSNEICDVAIENLKSMTAMDDDGISNWMATSCNTPLPLSVPDFQTEIHGFLSEDDLSFELIQLRTWFRFIGYPLSLIYRLPRRFHYHWTTQLLSNEYQYELRHFVFSTLRGYVTETDFFDLESAIFGPFGFIIQRMAAFRIFKKPKCTTRPVCGLVPRLNSQLWLPL